jgi:hypothetical protein
MDLGKVEGLVLHSGDIFDYWEYRVSCHGLVYTILIGQ